MVVDGFGVSLAEELLMIGVYVYAPLPVSWCGWRYEQCMCGRVKVFVDRHRWIEDVVGDVAKQIGVRNVVVC